MSSIAPAAFTPYLSMTPRPAAPVATSGRTGAALLLAAASIPAVLFGGAPLRTAAALVDMVRTAAAEDRRHARR